MKVLNVKFAPLFIPWQRRLQTFAVFIFLSIFLQSLSLIGFFTVVYLLFTRFYWLSLLYLVWYYFEHDRCHRGGRTFKSVRRFFLWTYFCRYFPISLVKTANLDPSKNYIFGVHPHGIMSFSAFGNFCTEGTNFSKTFPGITPHLLTLKEQFVSPFMGEFFQSFGAAASSEKSLKYILTNKGSCKETGQACALIVGGAAESLEAHQGKCTLVLKKRKGFIRIAFQTGAQLVPVFSFGENDLFLTVLNPKNSRLRKIQETFKKFTHFGLPIFWGRGVFNYSFGLMPLRRPLTTVIGKPIEVVKNEQPTQEEIDALHARYIKELIQLFEDHKKNYSIDENIKLEIE